MQQQASAAESLVNDQDATHPHSLETTQNGGDVSPPNPPESPNPPYPRGRRKKIHQLNQFLARFGPFSQDVCVQITSLLAAISVIDILKNQYQDTQCIPNGIATGITGFSYPSVAPPSVPSPFVQFDSNFITKACKPTYGTTIDEILSVFKGMVILNQVFFTIVNILKASQVGAALTNHFFLIRPWRKEVVDLVAMALSAGAFVAALLKIFVVIYIAFLNPKFTCPLSGVGNPAGCPDPTNSCTDCFFAGSTNDVVRLLNLEYDCNSKATAAEWAATWGQFPGNTFADFAASMTCSTSLQSSVFSKIQTATVGENYGMSICQSSCTIDPTQIVEAILLVITFPLSAIYMTYCMISWRGISIERQSVSTNIPPGASARASAVQKAIVKLMGVSKMVSTLTVLAKYILSSVSLLVILSNINGALVQCQALSGPKGLSGQAVEQACGASINSTYQVYILGCCALMFLFLLIFDIFAIQRNLLRGAAAPIGVGVIVLCIITIAVSSAQIVAISKKEVTFRCSRTSTLIQLGSDFNPPPSPSVIFNCPDTPVETSGVPSNTTLSTCKQLCNIVIPTGALALSASIVVQICFVIFEAFAYMYRGSIFSETQDQLQMSVEVVMQTFDPFKSS